MLEKLESLMSKMNEINYGYIINGNNIFKDNGTDRQDDFFKNYHLQSPSKLLSSKYGVCWDQVELERYYLDKENITCDTYFIIEYDNDNSNTHTFIVVSELDKFYWFEHSWYSNRGIHEYNSLNALLLDVKSKFGCYKDVRIYKYEKPSFNIGVIDFIKHCESGKKVNI